MQSSSLFSTLDTRDSRRATVSGSPSDIYYIVELLKFVHLGFGHTE